ncbi:MAG TPA: coenzyme F420-0:L-glutamate ligase [Solirubrobacteraceae bacterium]|jgi:coenzyme F420-0:L-glutamate ligase/coenzyme F420-1:gamma-L-glutamate ligase|nr:coenzyme F420-0:L-glutamate ligase [Solirubrobacteraceae bacterium]
MGSFTVRALPGIPEIGPGDDLPAIVAAALARERTPHGAILALAHTAVSKAEGAIVDLDAVSPGERAIELAREQDKDPRLVQVVLDESVELLRAERGVLIARTRHGFVCANAGVDVSNAGRAERAILLPRDPDSSARAIRAALGEDPPAVLVTDSFGRAWRHGQLDVAIGLAGLQPLDDWRGRTDSEGLELRATWLAVADAVAAAADLARAKDSGEPAVLVEGLPHLVGAADGPGARSLLRPRDEDLFL